MPKIMGLVHQNLLNIGLSYKTVLLALVLKCKILTDNLLAAKLQHLLKNVPHQMRTAQSDLSKMTVQVQLFPKAGQ